MTAASRAESSTVAPSPSARRARYWRRHPIRARWIAAIVATVFTLLVCEIAMRVYLSSTASEYNLDRAQEVVREPGGIIYAGDLIKPGPDDLLPYVGRPGVSGIFRGAPVTMNSRGFRGPEVSVPKPPDTFRFLVLGDSVFFGWGVADDEVAIDVLVRHLNETAPPGAPHYDYVNTALPGENAAMEAEVLARTIDVYEPDVIILQVNSNDFGLPGFLRAAPSYRELNRSYLLDFAYSALTNNMDNFRRESMARIDNVGMILCEQDFDDIAAAMDNDGWSRDVRGTLPERFAPLFGRTNFEEGLDRIAALASERFIPVRSVIYDTRNDPFFFPTEPLRPYHTSPFVTEPRQRGFTDCPLMKYEIEYRDMVKPKPEDMALNVKAGDFHPTAPRHELAAKAMYEQLMKDGLLPDGESRGKW